MSRVTVVLKTNEGGLWILPQVNEFRRRGHLVTVIIPGGDGRLRRALDAAGVAVEASPFDFSFRPSFDRARGLLALRRLIRQTRPDVLFYHLYASALAVRLASFGLRARRVHMVAGPLYLESRPIRAAERILCRLDDHVIAGSEYTKRRYREIGMPERRLSSIPYGVDVKHFMASDDRRVELFGCSQTTFVVIMIAYVYAPKSSVYPGVGIKGHDVLLDAWRAFARDHPDSLLVLVGGGFGDEGEAHRQRLISEHDVQGDPRVRWLDSVDDVRDLYSSADLSVSPSVSENHGAALEASAMSLPSIVSDSGGLPETVTPETGWIVRAGDVSELGAALVAAACEHREGTLPKKGARARLNCEATFSHDVVVAKVVDVAVGRAGEAIAIRGRVLAFTEQRAWVDGSIVLGRKGLPIVQELAGETLVRLMVRVGPAEEGGVGLAPASDPVPLTWPTRGSPIRFARQAVGVIASVVGEARGADVVYADQPGVVGGLGLVVGRILRKPLVVNVVGDADEAVHPSVIPGVRGRVAHAVLPRLQGWACAQATYANYVTARVLQERYPPRRARRVFASSTVTALGEPRPRPFPADSVSVVTVASLDQPYKGVADLIDAIRICRSAGLDARLTVVGDGRLRAQLTSAGSALGPGVVRFSGHLYGFALYDELGRHDVFVLASWTEGLPRVVVEAMIDGVPVVATGVGGVPELLEAHRISSPRNPAALADRIQALVHDEAAWRHTIRRNVDVSARLLTEWNPVLGDFVTAVSGLARGGADDSGPRRMNDARDELA